MSCRVELRASDDLDVDGDIDSKAKGLRMLARQ